MVRIDSNALALKWAIEVLQAQFDDVHMISKVVIQETPYSLVTQIATDKGLFYLKQTPPLLSLEGVIMQTLKQKYDAPVPSVLAINHSLYCFLMRDAGIALRKILQLQFDLTLLLQAVKQFATLQRQLQNHINHLIKIGVPDWRITHFPRLFLELIEEKDCLLEDGLSLDEYQQLPLLMPHLEKACLALAECSILPTIVQPDFQDNNTLYDPVSKKLTTIDLGEISISNPLFSLINCLETLCRYYPKYIDSEYYKMIKNTYFTALDSSQSLQSWEAIFNNTVHLWPLYSALAHYRLRQACDHSDFLQSQAKGKLAKSMRELIKSLL